MAPSIILLYICSIAFAALLIVFLIYLFRVAVAAAKEKQGLVERKRGVSKIMHPVENNSPEIVQSEIRLLKVK